MKLFLHEPDEASDLSGLYRDAFKSAVELYILSAYLTDWDDKLVLNKACQKFKFIIGKDFGITRKAACQKVLKWLPKRRKTSFMVADEIAGFHPKAMFWKEANGSCHAIIGSSNLTKAAFESNYEANTFLTVAAPDFHRAKAWIAGIERLSVIVSEDWLSKYKEAKRLPIGRSSRGSKRKSLAVVQFDLPTTPKQARLIKHRRDVLKNYNRIRATLEKLFIDCANGKLLRDEFYEQLLRYWHNKSEPSTRVQGRGWERTGRKSDFHKIAQSFIKIIQAPDDERDDIVAEQIDWLSDEKEPARGAFFSEMLCLRFPDLYPILNKPIWAFIKDKKFKAPRGASEGERYVDLAKKLRASLMQNPSHPARNLLELDGVLWLRYGQEM